MPQTHATNGWHQNNMWCHRKFGLAKFLSREMIYTKLYLAITKLELHEDCSRIAETAAVKITFTKTARAGSWYQIHTSFGQIASVNIHV